jgi:hypothetical protein
VACAPYEIWVQTAIAGAHRSAEGSERQPYKFYVGYFPAGQAENDPPGTYAVGVRSLRQPFECAQQARQAHDSAQLFAEQGPFWYTAARLPNEMPPKRML